MNSEDKLNTAARKLAEAAMQAAAGDSGQTDHARIVFETVERECLESVPAERHGELRKRVREIVAEWTNTANRVVRGTRIRNGESEQADPPGPVDLPKPSSAREVAALVCSDVHLGTRESEFRAFFETLSKQRDVEILLLGDILDLWIYSSTQTDDDLVRTVTVWWDKLWAALHEARERGCDVHFVPGNHDAFVFFIEAETSDPWSRAIVQRAPILREIMHATDRRRLLGVADIHYPYMLVEEGGARTLLTHGHYESWCWRLMTGLEERGLTVPLELGGASIALAHKHARLLRRAAINANWLLRTGRFEDTAISITNAVLRAYDGAIALLQDNDVDSLVALVDTAIGLYFGAPVAVTPEEEGRLRETLMFMHSWSVNAADDLEKIRCSHETFLRRACGENVHLEVRDGEPMVSRTPLREFAEFNQLIVGHFHKPRSANGVFDVGGFVESTSSCLAIDTNGAIRRPS